METSTRDTFFNGEIVLQQHPSGYRFSVDAVLLTHLALEQSGTAVVDLGTGCGVIPIMLAYRCPMRHIVGVELQPELCELARSNVVANNAAGRVRILEKDMNRLALTDVDGPVDLVVSNPPYRKLGSGRINADSQRAVARHEVKVDLETLLKTARRLLKKSGRFCIIYPSIRLVDLVAAMRAKGLEPKWITLIHSRAASPARLVAVTGVKGGRPGVETGPPLHLYQPDGTYTETMTAMFSEKPYSSNVFMTSPDLTLG